MVRLGTGLAAPTSQDGRPAHERGGNAHDVTAQD